MRKFFYVRDLKQKRIIMQINFTGTQNTAQYNQLFYPIMQDENGRTFYSKNQYITACHFNTELTDDVFGQDFTKYKEVLENSAMPEAKNNIYSRFMNISTLRPNYSPEDINIFLNGIPVNICDENISLISFISKILNKISKQPENEFTISGDYSVVDDGSIAVAYGQNVEENSISDEDFLNTIIAIHDPKNIKNGVNEMIKNITDRMIDYFS